ncbi:MAG: IS66 family insertion sequence element accessory protein TnpB [Proteobacteria bacterium]|nr:IS66 family insertion sequence element accessory protein TnpB [Pseudomonadota bacterium]
MITPPAGIHIWLVAGATDMRRGFDGLAAVVAQQLNHDPFSGQVFVFRGRRGHLIKLLFWDGQGLVLYAKRLDRGHFVWPATAEGAVSLTPAQLSMLTEGIDWRAPFRTFKPELVG